MDWWLHALDCIDQSNVSAGELLKKIDNSSTKSTTGLGSRGISSRSSFCLSIYLVYSMVPMVIFLFKNSCH